MHQDIMKAIEQVAAQADNDQESMEKEAFINEVVQQIIGSTRSAISSSTTCFPFHFERWAMTNRQRVALQMGEVARILLHKEMFGK